MSELESKEVKDYPDYGEAPQRSETSAWDRNIAPALSFVIPYTLVWQLMQIWVPWHFAVGIGFFVGGLVSFGFRGPRVRHYSFGKWVVIYLLSSTGITLLAYVLKALGAVLFKS